MIAADGRAGEANNVNRRHFLKTTGAAVATVGLSLESALSAEESLDEQAKQFLKKFVEGWLPLDTAGSEAAWLALTDANDEHAAERARCDIAVNEYIGAKPVVENLRRFLTHREELNEQTVRQLDALNLIVSAAPGTIPAVVQMRSVAEARHDKILNEYAFTLPAEPQPEPISESEISSVLISSSTTSLPVRRIVWDSSKAVGAALRPGLLRLRDLRNRVAREMGFESYFALQVAEYGMTVDEMTFLTEGFINENRPLYEQLHTWAKRILAKRYDIDPPPGPIPAHWLTNRWGQNWPGLVDGIDLDAPFMGKPKEFVLQQAEAFYLSMGFPKLPEAFHRKSDFYPVVEGQRKKDSGGWTYHMDRDKDVRCLMSIEPNSTWFTIAHHELGHVYYMLGYSTPQVPHLLRGGANRAFHEGIGDLIGLAAGQPKYLESIGLLPAGAPAAGSVEWLLEPALAQNACVFLPWAAGTMTRFEKEFYGGEVSDSSLNAAWWDSVLLYQGIAPPGIRSERLCDAATKSHINNDPAQYYDYALGTIIKFQLHDYIAREILKQDPRNCNYFGNKQVGEFLKEIFSLGATQDWRVVLKKTVGSELSAKPMVAYFAPLAEWLKQQNEGKTVGW